MITEQDLREAIAECQGIRNPSANTAIKLAAFLTIQRELFGDQQNPPSIERNASYSYAAEPLNLQKQNVNADTVGSYGNSDFLEAISGKPQDEMWAVMDDLMDTLKMVNQRVYDGVMRKIK